MSQPAWECIAQLGDKNPIDHGGYWILRDTTGVYAEEAELLLVPDDEDREYTIYRFTLDRCTFINGVLSDNKFHPEHAAWWAKPEAERKARPQDTTYLKNIADSIGMEVDELADQFCSEDALKRAVAYRAVGDYHGFENLDSYPQFCGALHKACDWSSRAQQRWQWNDLRSLIDHAPESCAVVRVFHARRPSYRPIVNVEDLSRRRNET